MTKLLEERASQGRAGLRRRLLLSFGAQGVAFAVIMAQQLCLVPLFLSLWGSELYGKWLILVAAADFLRLVDLGLHYHLANVMRMAWARGEHRDCERTLKAGMGLYCVLLLVAGSGILVSTGLVDWPALLGATNVPFGGSTLALLAVTSLILVPRNLIIAVYAALGEFSRGEIFYSLFILVQTVAIGAALAFGAQPQPVAILYLATSLLFGLGAVLLDQALRYPGVRLGVALPGIDEAIQIARRAIPYSVGVLSEVALLRAPILILGALAPRPGAVVLFAVSRTFTGIVRQFALQIARASGIEMSRQFAQQDAVGQRRLYERTGFLTSGIIGLLSGVMIAISPSFIHLWTRGQVAFDPWVTGAFLATIFLTAPAQAGIAQFQYTSRPQPLVRASLFQVTCSLLLCVLLIPLAGSLGAAVALGAAEFAAFTGYVSIAASRELQVRAVPFLMRSYALSTVMGLLGFVVTTAIGTSLQVRSFLDLALLCAVSMGVAVIPSFYLLLSRDQRRWVWSGLRTRLKLVLVKPAARWSR